jgi:hypothetical protein
MTRMLPARELGKFGAAIAEPTQQLALGQMVTSEAARVLHAEVARRHRKTTRSRQPEDSFGFQCRARHLPVFQRKWRLLKLVQTPRKDGKDIPKTWEFDFCWPQFEVIVEIDGGIWMVGGGAHSHPMDIERNMAKRNDAALSGLSVFAFTPAQVKRGEAVDYTMRVLAARGWQP